MNLPVAPLVAGAVGIAAALGVALTPVPILEGLVMDSGLPSVLAAAEPPLGFTARAAVALGAGGMAAMFAWVAAFVLLGTRGLSLGARAKAAPEEVAMPVLRRADAHPDAPPRPPLLATRDLGTPFLEVRAPNEADTVDVVVQPAQEALAPVAETPKAPPAERELPEDLDQPLSGFDPDAILPTPMPPPVAPRTLRRPARPAVFDERERFEVFELTPPVRRTPPPFQPRPEPVSERPQPEPIARPETEASVHALLERLERGVVRTGLSERAKAAPTPPRSRAWARGSSRYAAHLARRA